MAIERKKTLASSAAAPAVAVKHRKEMRRKQQNIITMLELMKDEAKMKW